MNSDKPNRSFHPLAPLLIAVVGIYALGLVTCWLDVNVFSRAILNRLPDSALSTLDSMYGTFVDIQAPFVYQIF